MFQIPEFEHSEQEEDSSSAYKGPGPSPGGAPLAQRRTAPDLRGDAGHQSGQQTSGSHYGDAGTVETRSRHSSYPTATQEDEEMEEEELSPFRGRSRSAPPNLWAAQRYGRELRRMSDEFQGSFQVSETPEYQDLPRRMPGAHTPSVPPAGRALSSPKGLPRPKSAGTATQMRQSPSWTRIIQSWWDRNLGRGGSAPAQ